MWVFRKEPDYNIMDDDIYEVGYFTGQTFHMQYELMTLAEAESKVHWLNGGK